MPPASSLWEEAQGGIHVCRNHPSGGGFSLALDSTGGDTFDELILCAEEHDELRQDRDQGQGQNTVPGKAVSPSMDSLTNRDMGYFAGVWT